MATKRQTIEVGVFLTVMFALLAIVLIALAGFRHEHLDHYRITFEETVSGLSEGSKVTYRGIPVGKITHLVVNDENLVAVTIGVDPQKVTLREGVQAKYNMETLFGPFTIDLAGGAEDARPLKPGEKIPVATSLLGNIEREVPGTLADIRKVAAQLRQIVYAIEPQDVAALADKANALLDNAHQGITEVRAEAKGVAQATHKAVDQALAELQKANQQLAPSLDGLQKAVATLNQTLEAAHQALDENREPVADTVKNLDAITRRLNAQLERLDVPAVVKAVETSAQQVGQAAEKLGAASDAVAQGRRDLSRSLQAVERPLLRSLDELERSLRAARALLETLERDPSALLRGKRPRTEGAAP